MQLFEKFIPWHGHDLGHAPADFFFDQGAVGAPVDGAKSL